VKARILCAAVLIAACGGPSAERPLDVTVGVSRDELIRELRSFEYCQHDQAVHESETFPRCEVTGVEFGQSWVVAHYDEGGRVTKVQRWERYPEDQRGVERFNALVEQRTKANGPSTEEAKKLIVARQELPAGTRTWVAFRRGETTLVGVYLLQPSAPENATVLEEIIDAR